MNAIKSRTETGFVDEYGTEWTIVTDDGRFAAVESEDRAGMVNLRDADDITPMEDGKTFGVNCHDEFVVRNGKWIENGGYARD